MIVANTGKVTELIEHRGSLQSAHEKALLYVAKGRYKINRIVKTEVVLLWTDCSPVVPWNNPHRDIQRKIAMKPELFLVGTENRIVASVMAGYDAHRGWINYLAMHPDHQDISNFIDGASFCSNEALHEEVTFKLGLPKWYETGSPACRSPRLRNRVWTSCVSPLPSSIAAR